MQPYYDDGIVTIYHGDCRDLLPQLTGDIVLTDLPYGIGLDYGPSFDDSPSYVELLVAEALPLMRACAPVVALTCGVPNLWRYPPATWVLSWTQDNSGTGSGPWGFNVWQPVLVYGPDPYLARGLGRRPDVIRSAASGGDLHGLRKGAHPCPKPLGSWRAVMLRVSPSEDDVIIDPMMGSGTSLVAAKYSGRRAIGIEIEERYCELAARRLCQEVLAFDSVA
jgi:hypothetical protein